MSFKRYNSIENSYNLRPKNLFITVCGADLVQVSEKLDGANYGFLVKFKDGEVSEVLPTKRSSIAGTDFYNSSQVVDRNKLKIEEASRHLKSEHKGLSEIQFYGELIANGIQKRVRYFEDNDFKEFYMFDILLKFADEDRFMPPADVEKVAERFKLKHVHVFGYMSVEEALNFDTNFLSTLYPTEGNYSEGVVLKPVSPIIHNSGQRSIIKIKSEHFSEKSKNKKKDNSNIKAKLSAGSRMILENELLIRNVENRAKNAAGNIAPIGKQDFGKFLKYVNSDIWSEVSHEIKDPLSTEELALLNKVLNADIARLIRPIYLEMIYGM